MIRNVDHGAIGKNFYILYGIALSITADDYSNRGGGTAWRDRGNGPT